MSPIRVVVDTNVMVSGLLWKGKSHNLIKLAEENQITFCVCTEMLEELDEVLRREKFGKRIKALSTSVEQLMFLVETLVEIIDVKGVFPYMTTDTDDNVFLSCAQNSKVKYVISGDEHLLILGCLEEISIISVSDFFEREGLGF